MPLEAVKIKSMVIDIWWHAVRKLPNFGEEKGKVERRKVEWMEEGGGGGYNSRKTKCGNYQGKNEAIVMKAEIAPVTPQLALEVKLAFSVGKRTQNVYFSRSVHLLGWRQSQQVGRLPLTWSGQKTTRQVVPPWLMHSSWTCSLWVAEMFLSVNSSTFFPESTVTQLNGQRARFKTGVSLCFIYARFWKRQHMLSVFPMSFKYFMIECVPYIKCSFCDQVNGIMSHWK